MNKYRKILSVPIGKRVQFTEEQRLKLHFIGAACKMFKQWDEREKQMLDRIDAMITKIK